MEVMNSTEFEENSVLIGQSGKTHSFGVSDDPMLMSMLSTGLYANPLRTMLQEIMFNAWDAHRMGLCLDRPIDIYLNETSGLIIRDYGPGIHPSEMHGIYCIYGNSTKRKDDNQTGGFGLGSKSPFAYTDSFMVTNQFAGKKSMYVIKRATDENNGGPGMTEVVTNIPTDETGLTVTVPFKNDRDRERAHEYIKDLLFLSGIKANIHYMDTKVELIESESLTAGQYIMNKESGTGLVAVYGGVRYRIEEDDAYSADYRFLRKLSQSLGSFFIGFAPNTLTPLPNREGLNLSERSVESIQTQLETMCDAFRTICGPVVKDVFQLLCDNLAKSGIQDHFLPSRWMQIVYSQNDLNSFTQMADFMKHCEMKSKPDGISSIIWKSMWELAVKKPDTMRNLLGSDEYENIAVKVFLRKYPHLRSKMQRSYRRKLANEESGNWIAKMNQVISKLSEITEQDLSGSLRLKPSNSDNWLKASSTRRAGASFGSNSFLSFGTHQETPEHWKIGNSFGQTNFSKSSLASPSGDEVFPIMMEKTIVLAKTLTALNNSPINAQQHFAPNADNSQMFSRFSSSGNPYHYYHFVDNIIPIPALIVHSRKDGYEKAKAYLESIGYTVIEGKEPEAKPKPSLRKEKDDTSGKTKTVPVFPLLDISRSDNCSVTEVEDPECYFCCTRSAFDSYSTYDKPSNSLLSVVQKTFPRTAVLLNAGRRGILDRKGVPELRTVIHERVEKLLKNKDRILKMYLHKSVLSNCPIPQALLKLPEFQKTMKVPYIRTKEAEAFHQDYAFLMTVQDERSHYVDRETQNMIKAAFAECKKHDSVSSVIKFAQKARILDSYVLSSQVGNMSKHELKSFSEKLSRFLRTI